MVTAQRREQTLIEIPQSVSVISTNAARVLANVIYAPTAPTTVGPGLSQR